MIRIISGKYGGRKLLDCHAPGVRPTLARVRKSLLQILEPFENKTILDLFSGAGTIGIEALSRGAAHVTFVERDFEAYRVLNENLNHICVDDDVNTYRMDVRQFFIKNDRQYNIIFADPPYGLFEFDFIFNSVKPFLKKDGIFSMEMKKQPIEFSNVRVKTYGKTQVVFWEGKE